MVTWDSDFLGVWQMLFSLTLCGLSGSWWWWQWWAHLTGCSFPLRRLTSTPGRTWRSDSQFPATVPACVLQFWPWVWWSHQGVRCLLDLEKDLRVIKGNNTTEGCLLYCDSCSISPLPSPQPEAWLPEEEGQPVRGRCGSLSSPSSHPRNTEVTGTFSRGFIAWTVDL